MGVCCILLGGWAKVIVCVTASALPTTLSFLVLKPSIFLISETPHLPHLFRRWKGENATTSAQASSASPSPCLSKRRTSVGDVSTSKFAISLLRMACGYSRGPTEDGGAVGLEATSSPKWVLRSSRVFTSYNSI